MVLKLNSVQKQWFGRFEKTVFHFFCKSLTDEVETIFYESEAKRSKLFKSKFGYGKLSRKLFWKYFEPRHKSSERLKWGFFSLLQIFEWWKFQPLFPKVRQSVEKSLKKNLVILSFLENGSEDILSSKANVLSV